MVGLVQQAYMARACQRGEGTLAESQTTKTTTDVNRRLVTLAGGLAIFGAVWLIMAITVAESLTPGYSISKYQISGLGSPIFLGTCTTVHECLTGPSSPVQPASAVFVSSVFVSSILGLWYAYLLRKATTHRKFALGVAVAATGWFVVGVSYLPFYLGLSGEGVATVAFILHLSGAYTNFFVGWLAALSTYRFTRAPMKYITVALVAVSATAFLLMFSGNYLGLGLGGMQRMGVYPDVLWSVAFGAYLTRGLD
jgi:hypothetical membrane protein